MKILVSLLLLLALLPAQAQAHYRHGVGVGFGYVPASPVVSLLACPQAMPLQLATSYYSYSTYQAPVQAQAYQLQAVQQVAAPIPVAAPAPTLAAVPCPQPVALAAPAPMLAAVPCQPSLAVGVGYQATAIPLAAPFATSFSYPVGFAVQAFNTHFGYFRGNHGYHHHSAGLPFRHR